MKKLMLMSGIAVMGSVAVISPVVQAEEGTAEEEGSVEDLRKDAGSINELWGNPTLSYGGNLSPEQKESTYELFGITDRENIEEVGVVGQDLHTYLGSGNVNANMYSSAYITPIEGGDTVATTVTIVTPENITGVSTTQYENAVSTAGAKGVNIEIGSPVAVSGHSALVGIYKAYDDKGLELDEDRMKVAQQELDTVTGISKDLNGEDGFNQEALSKAMVETKQELNKKFGEAQGELGDKAEEEVRKIIKDRLKANKLDKVITDEHVDKLVDLAINYAKTGAVSDKDLDEQLENLAKDVKDRLQNATDEFGNKITSSLDDGFLASIKEFFVNIFNAIVGIFQSDEPKSTEPNEEPSEEPTIDESVAPTETEEEVEETEVEEPQGDTPQGETPHGAEQQGDEPVSNEGQEGVEEQGEDPKVENEEEEQWKDGTLVDKVTNFLSNDKELEEVENNLDKAFKGDSEEDELEENKN